MKKALIDSGPMTALFNSRDSYHETSKAFMKRCRYNLVTTMASITEVMYLLETNLFAAADFLEWLARGAVEIADITSADFTDIKEYMMKYGDLPMDFADATLMVVSDRERINKIATFDSDFDIYRTAAKEKLNNIISIQ